jgi:hypothetical protein
MIIDRRTLLRSGAAVSTVAFVPGLSAGASGDVGLGIERFVFDNRFSDAIDAARSAAAKGIRLSEVDGDMTALWYDDLNLRWKKRPMTLAGVTGEDALFVLATLAPEYRMRVVHQAQVGVAALTAQGRVESLPLYSWIIAPVSATTQS